MTGFREQHGRGGLAQRSVGHGKTKQLVACPMGLNSVSLVRDVALILRHIILLLNFRTL